MNDEPLNRHRALSRQAWVAFAASVLVTGALVGLPSGALGQVIHLSDPVAVLGALSVVVLVIVGLWRLVQARRLVG